MKWFLSFFSLCIMFSISCVKHDSDPGCDVKGTWMGRWSASDQEGTWVCYASNEETNFGGYVFVWFDFPMLENRGIGIEGKLKDREISFKHYFSGATLTVNGSVDSDSIARGSFDVSNIGMSGTWQGERMPTLDILAVDSFPINLAESYFSDLSCDIERNHLFVRNSNEIREYNYNGGVVRTFNVEKSGKLCFDGNHLWFCNGSYGKIVETDTLGEVMSEFDAPNAYCDAIMFDGVNLKISSGYSRTIYSVSKSGVLQGNQDYEYLMISSLCKYGNGYLAISNSFPGTIFSLNASSIPVKAFRFTNGILYGLAIDGDDVWCISQRYIMSSSNPPMPPTNVTKLYRLKLN